MIDPTPAPPGARIDAPLATTAAELHTVWTRLNLDDGFYRALRFVPRPDDVMVACYFKCGTTWTQQIVHGLRTGGDMSFDSIERIVPYFERAHGLGIGLDDAQVAEPRVFKTHLDYARAPKGARYVCVTREPGDALLSLYHFFSDTLLDPMMISVEEFARAFYMRSTEAFVSYWEHLASWWCARFEQPILFLSYEDLVQDLPGSVASIARFLGFDLDRATLDLVVEQSSFEFMRRHRERFASVNSRVGVDGRLHPVRFETVRRGRVGDPGRELSPEVRARLSALWAEMVEPRTGLADYGALRAAIRADRSV